MFAKTYGTREGLVPPDPRFQRILGVVTLEGGLILGGLLLAFGLSLALLALTTWGRVAFGDLSPEALMRVVIPSGTAILLGFQTATGSFFLSVLEIRASRRE
ncbi:MAG: hypothetical protein JO227_24025 [Acetobacteraceae bacterium]|nr:hypothetical protein [Acetobacteraceae bacterium]